ncbi:MAG: DUF6178 family protein [Desulfuromonadales bacterium]|nr:DUF6178 family protein [Desulfuromonadales bacterium]
MSIPVQKSLTTKEFAALNRPEQLEALRLASARQKMDLLLDSGDGDELLALLPPQDVYLLARELGSDQIPELLTMASPEQWTAFFDFDCWAGDTFDQKSARAWLAVLLQGEESWIASTLQEIDFELLVLMLHREIQVLSGPEEIHEDVAIAEGRRRERGYVLDYRDDDGAKLFGSLVDVLFRQAPEFCRYLLEAVRSESECQLEESVYRQRSDRLLDQGLPDPYAAQTVYAWIDPEQFVPGAERKVPLGGSATGTVPGAVLQLAQPGGVLGAALAAGVNDGTTWELACLVNKVLMAERVDLGEFDQVSEIAARTFVTLNLALEYLVGDDGEGANRCLHETYVEQLFRLGFSLTLRLQRRARALQDSAIGPYLDRSFRALVSPLLQRRPHFPEVVVRPERGGMRPFASLREVRLVEEWLDRLDVQRRLFEEHFPFPLPAPEDWELAGCHPESGSELMLSTIFLTALANRLLGRPFAPQPLAVGELGELHAMVTRNGKLDPELRKQTSAWLDSLEPGGSIFGTLCFDLWEEEFCAVRAADLDPRYVGGMIARVV